MQHDKKASEEAPRRKKKHRHEDHEGGGHGAVHDESNWLVSYADMMTLLFGFFVLMYSFSKIDKDKFEVVRKDMARAFGGKIVDDPGSPEGIRAVEKEIQTAVATAFEQSSDFNTKMEGDMLILTIRSDVLFPVGSADPGERAVKAIYKVHESIKDKPVELIEVEGHTDSDPISTVQYPSNWELSTARASSIVRLFENLKMDSKKLKAAGFGASRPAQMPEKMPTSEAAPGAAPVALPPVDIKQLSRRVIINLKINPNGQDIRKQLKDQGLDIKPSGSEVADAPESKSNPEQLSLQEKYESVQAKLKEAADRLAAAQAQEKKVKELEALRKKTDDLEKKIVEVQKKTQQTLEKTKQDVPVDKYE